MQTQADQAIGRCPRMVIASKSDEICRFEPLKLFYLNLYRHQPVEVCCILRAFLGQIHCRPKARTRLRPARLAR